MGYNMFMRRKKIVVFSALCLVLLGSFLGFREYKENTRFEGLLRVDKFRYFEKKDGQFVNAQDSLACGASMSAMYAPECGYCPGIIHEKRECYVDVSKLSGEEKRNEWQLY